jgi:hypothetical protein
MLGHPSHSEPIPFGFFLVLDVGCGLAVNVAGALRIAPGIEPLLIVWPTAFPAGPFLIMEYDIL